MRPFERTIDVLGPLRAVGPGGSAQLEGARQRTLMAALALRAGTVLSESSLVNALWGEDPPRTAVRTLHSHVARLRQALNDVGLGDVIARQEPGYRMVVPREVIDLCRFDDLVRNARGLPPAEAARTLTEALKLWSGDPLADAEPFGWLASEVERLLEARLSASEQLWEARLAIGEHADAVDGLARLVAAAPLREHLTGLLMTALYRCHRQAEALERYERIRAELAEELGIDPGPELQALHTGILRRESRLDAPAQRTAGAAPAQLPVAIGHFTGRTGELNVLQSCLDAASGDPRIAVISGLAGMGKTACGLRWAHAVKDRFPDGQIYVDLRGHDPEHAITPARVLIHVLRALGVPADHLPAEYGELKVVYRSLIAGKRILLFLDNAGTTDQVLPLVPPTSDSMVLVTGRNQLTGVDVHQVVHRIDLEALSGDDALTLFRRVLGTERVDHEPAAARRLALLCGYMPLALRIAAAKLAGRRKQRIADLVADLADSGERLDTLSLSGDAHGLRAVFASTFQTLSDPAARLFRLLGLHPGERFTSPMVAALIGVSVGRARRTIDELVATHLLNESEDGTFRFHDLLRLYAAELAQTEPDTEEVQQRLVDWYVGIGFAANRILDPRRDRIVPQPRFPLDDVPFGDDPAEVLAFLDSEYPNLTAVVSWADRIGLPEATCQLTYLLAGYYESRGHVADRITMCRAGAAAADGMQDHALEGLMRSGLGAALINARRYRDAVTVLAAALDIARAAGDFQSQSHLHNNIAVAYANLSEFDEAAKAFGAALALYTAHKPAWIPVGLNNLGTALAQSGQVEAAIEQLTRGLALARDVEDPRVESLLLNSLGEAYRFAGRLIDSLDSFEHALTIRRRIGALQSQAETMKDMGEVFLLRDLPDQALAHLTEALALTRTVDNPHLEATVLARIGQTHMAMRDSAAARSALTDALGIRARVPDALEEAGSYRALGDLAAQQGEEHMAATHWERASDLLSAAGRSGR